MRVSQRLELDRAAASAEREGDHTLEGEEEARVRIDSDPSLEQRQADYQAGGMHACKESVQVLEGTFL